MAPRINAWIQDGTFQLQRRAYEAYGEGVWENLEEEIPLTKADEDLGPLSLSSLPKTIPLNILYTQCTSQTAVGDACSTSFLAQKPLDGANQPSSPVPATPGNISTSISPIAEEIVSADEPSEETMPTSQLAGQTGSTSPTCRGNSLNSGPYGNS